MGLRESRSELGRERERWKSDMGETERDEK
jgi:hypothetical protein